MMQGFADEETDAFYRTGKTKAGYQSIAKVAFRKLDMLDAAKILDDLRAPPRQQAGEASGRP
jgi:proteic killer suppression protein